MGEIGLRRLGAIWIEEEKVLSIFLAVPPTAAFRPNRPRFLVKGWE